MESGSFPPISSWKACSTGTKFFGGAVILNHHDEWAPGGLLQQNQQQSFRGGGKSGNTYAPRALAEVGGYT